MGYLNVYGVEEGAELTVLTLRLLMSHTHTHTHTHIYIYIERERERESLFLMFLDHTQRRTTVGRTPLDE